MIARVTALVRDLVPRMYGYPGETRSERILRRVRVGIVIAACLVTLQSLLLVLGAWRNDRQIEVADLAAALDEPFDGMRVLEVKADRSSLRALHASIKAAL